MRQFTTPLGVPVRFLALEWREPWEFDHPSVVLEPIFRYSPLGTAADILIEDAAIDLADDAALGETTDIGPDETEVKEFQWRGWDVEDLRHKAEAVLRGEKVTLGLPDGAVIAVEQWIAFHKRADGEVDFEVAEPAGVKV